MIDGFWAKLEELVERSKGKIRADVAHYRIAAIAPAAGGDQGECVVQEISS